MSNDDDNAAKVVSVEITEVAATHFSLCMKGRVIDSECDSLDDAVVFGHYHLRCDKLRSECGEHLIHITDQAATSGVPGRVALSPMFLAAFQEFLASLERDPTPVMTGEEQAQVIANRMMDAYSRNTN